MKKFIFFSAVLFTISIGTSQKGTYPEGSSGGGSSNFDIFIRTVDINQKNLAFGLTEAEFDAIKDEAYANSNFVQGKIFQDDKLLRSNIPMRYNAYADEIEIKSHASEKNYGALMKDPSIYVKMGNDIYVLIPYEDSNENGGYFNILADGKTYDLYKKTTTVFQEPTKAKTSYQQDTPPAFNKITKYYLVKDGIFFELPTGKTKLLKVMDSKKNEVKNYIGENNLDLDKEADLIKAVAYFDTLL